MFSNIAETETLGKGGFCSKADYFVIRLSVCLPVCLSVWWSICLSFNLSIHLSFYLPMHLSIHLFIFWLRNMLRAAATCYFSTVHPPKVPRTWGVLGLLSLTWVYYHSRGQFLISHPARWLRIRPLASLLFDPLEPQHIGKNTVFREFFTSFSLLWLFSHLLLHLSISRNFDF